MYASVWFRGDGNIVAEGGTILQSYVANTWYKIRVSFDRTDNTYSVRINDVSKATAVKGTYTDPYNIEGFDLTSEWAEVNCYFDDVKVFELPPPEIPEFSLAATTTTSIATILYLLFRRRLNKTLKPPSPSFILNPFSCRFCATQKLNVFTSCFI